MYTMQLLNIILCIITCILIKIDMCTIICIIDTLVCMIIGINGTIICIIICIVICIQTYQYTIGLMICVRFVHVFFYDCCMCVYDVCVFCMSLVCVCNTYGYYSAISMDVFITIVMRLITVKIMLSIYIGFL